MWWVSQRVDLHEKKAIADFYQFIWKLFFLGIRSVNWGKKRKSTGSVV